MTRSRWPAVAHQVIVAGAGVEVLWTGTGVATGSPCGAGAAAGSAARESIAARCHAVTVTASSAGPTGSAHLRRLRISLDRLKEGGMSRSVPHRRSLVIKAKEQSAPSDRTAVGSQGSPAYSIDALYAADREWITDAPA